MDFDVLQTSTCCCRDPDSQSRIDSAGTMNAALPAQRQVLSLLASLLPGLGLMLVPKCPACVAGYIAAATGLGISISTAAYLRSAVLAGLSICFGLILFGWLRRFRADVRIRRDSN